MPGGIGPLLLTGVAIVGATAVVASPILPPPTEIRVSASELTADGQPLDVLAPDFLKTVNAGDRGWRNPLKVFGDMRSGFIVNRSSGDATQTLKDALGSADPGAGVGGRAGQPIYAVLSTQVRTGADGTLGLAPAVAGAAGLAGPFTDLVERLPAPQQALDDIFGALADIGNRFGAAGEAFIGQFGLTPGVAAELTEAGPQTLSPLERLHDLVLQPFLLATERDSDRDALLDFERLLPIAMLRAVVDALVRYLPSPIGQRAGLIDTIDRGIDDLATRMRDALSAPSSRSPQPVPEAEAISDDAGVELRRGAIRISTQPPRRDARTEAQDHNDELETKPPKLTLVIPDEFAGSDSSPRGLRGPRGNTGGVAADPPVELSPDATAPSPTTTATRTPAPSAPTKPDTALDSSGPGDAGSVGDNDDD